MSLPTTKQQQLEELYKDVWTAEEQGRCKAWNEVLLRHTIKESGVQYDMVELAQLGLLDIIMQAGNPSCELSRTVPSLVQSGFPMDIRGLGWKILLDVLVRRARGQYDILVAQSLGELANKQELSPEDLRQHTSKLASEDEEGNVLDADNLLASEMASWNSHARVWLQQIEKDLPRTFAGHPMMQGPGRQALRRVLAAFTMLDPKVGYCQGMNFIAAVLLMFMPEEDAFWCLVIIVEQVLTGYFSPDMMATKVDQRVFQQLVATQLPAVAVHLEAVGADISCVFAQWFLCAFVNSLPLETCLRVWDVLFYQKSSATLFQIGLALVDMYSEALLAARDVLEAFQVVQGMAALTHDATRLLALAMVKYSSLDNDHLQALRQQARAQVEKEEQAEERAEADRQLRQQNLQDSGSRIPDFRMSVVKKLIARALDKRTSESKGDLEATAGRSNSENGGRVYGRGTPDAADGISNDANGDGDADVTLDDAAGLKVTPPHSVPDAADSPLLAVQQAGAGDAGGAGGQAGLAPGQPPVTNHVADEQELAGSYVPPEVPLFPEARDFISLSPSESTAVPDIDDLLSVPSMRRDAAAAAAASLLTTRPSLPSTATANLLKTCDSEPVALHGVLAAAAAAAGGAGDGGQVQVKAPAGQGSGAAGGHGHVSEPGLGTGRLLGEGSGGSRAEQEELAPPVERSSKLRALDALLWTDDPLPPMQQHPPSNTLLTKPEPGPTSTPPLPEPSSAVDSSSQDLISMSTTPSGAIQVSDISSRVLTGEAVLQEGGEALELSLGATPTATPPASIAGQITTQLDGAKSGNEAAGQVSSASSVTPKPPPPPPPLSPAMELALQIAMRHAAPRSSGSNLAVDSVKELAGEGVLLSTSPDSRKPTSPMAFQTVGQSGSQLQGKAAWGVEVVGSVNSAFSVGLSSAPTDDSDGTQGGTHHVMHVDDVFAPHHTHGTSGAEFKDDWVDLHVGEDTLTPHSHSSSLHNTAGGGPDAAGAHARRGRGGQAGRQNGTKPGGQGASGTDKASNGQQGGRELRKTISNGWVDGGLHAGGHMNGNGSQDAGFYPATQSVKSVSGQAGNKGTASSGAAAGSKATSATRPAVVLESALHDDHLLMAEVVTPAAVQDMCEKEGLQPILSRCLELHYRAGNLSEVLAELQGREEGQELAVQPDGSDGNIMKALVESASCGWVREVLDLLQQAQASVQLTSAVTEVVARTTTQAEPEGGDSGGTAVDANDGTAMNGAEGDGGSSAQAANATDRPGAVDGQQPDAAVQSSPAAAAAAAATPGEDLVAEAAEPPPAAAASVAAAMPSPVAIIKSAEDLLLKQLNNEDREMGITHAAELLCGYQWLAGEACDKLHHMAHKLAQQQAMMDKLQAKVQQLTQRLVDQENDLSQLQALAEEVQQQQPSGLQPAGGSSQALAGTQFRSTAALPTGDAAAGGAAGDGGRFLGALQKLRERSARPLSPPAWGAVQGPGMTVQGSGDGRNGSSTSGQLVEVSKPVGYVQGQEGGIVHSQGSFGVNFWGGVGQGQGWGGGRPEGDVGGQRQEEGRMSKWLNRFLGKEEGGEGQHPA